MTLTVMKVFYKKQKPNIVTYRNYKYFSNEAFMFDVKNSIIQMTSENNDLEFDRFKTALVEAIQRHAPMKKRYVRVNQARSSHPEVFCKPATLLKKRLWHRCFPVNFVKFLRTPFFMEHLRWLLLLSTFHK